MKLIVDRNGNIRYFGAKLGWKEQFDTREIEILSSGSVPMLIPPVSVHGKKNNTIQYDISQYSTLEFYLSCILSREQFADLMLQCIDVFRRMQQIYLNYKNLVLDLDKIYVLLSDRTVHFVYLPLVNSKREASIQGFFQLLIQKASRSTYEQAHFLDECAAWLQRPAPFGLNEFESLIREIGGIGEVVAVGAAAQPAGHLGSGASPIPPVQPLYVSPAAASPSQLAEPDPSRFYKPAPAAPTAQASSTAPTAGLQYGATCQLGVQPGGTVVLGAPVPPAPPLRFFLIREKTGERIELSQFPFVIGTEAGSVTYCVTDNHAISRKHARFSLRDEECLIKDLNSTNKTYVNSCALSPETEQLLNHNDKIRLANDDFIFIREE